MELVTPGLSGGYSYRYAKLAVIYLTLAMYLTLFLYENLNSASTGK
jgi:hypothetical protein